MSLYVEFASLATLLYFLYLLEILCTCVRGLDGAVVTHSPPTSEVSGSNPRPYLGNLVVAYRWSAVYSIEP